MFPISISEIKRFSKEEKDEMIHQPQEFFILLHFISKFNFMFSFVFHVYCNLNNIQICLLQFHKILFVA